LQFADEFKRFSNEDYQLNTSKKKKLTDKKEMDEKVDKARHPLTKIMKLVLNDFSGKLQMTSINSDITQIGSKRDKFRIKTYIAGLKLKVLNAYRRDNSLDIKQFARKMT